MSTRPLETPWMTKLEAARHARVPTWTLERALADGSLESRKIGRQTVIRIEWVDAWLEALEEKTA
jgi:excisionase family DNA binding protein